MMLIIGLFIIPIIIALIIKTKDYKTADKQRRKINLLIFLISIIFIIVTFIVNADPFKFEIESGRDYFIYSLIIFIFTPFLWISFGHFILSLTKRIRIKKNSKIKDKNEFIYYRDDLDKLSPGLLMYVRSLDVDIKKAISSSILKLKLTKNIKEKNRSFVVNKTDNLLTSEKMIVDLISDKYFDQNKYIEELKNESIEHGYIKKNNVNIVFRIIKLFIIILFPIINTILSFKFDSYTYDNYKTYIYNHKRYVLVQDDIGDIYYDHPKNRDDYYHGYVKELGREFYDKSLVRANKYDNEIVRKTIIMQMLDAIYFSFTVILDIIFVYLIIEELMYLNKNYKRTKKGIDVVNKSYALKNFLKDFSDIKNKSEKELILWEYYLVYASVLGINVKINDKLIEKYIK